ncbi:DUF1573 domain-containing protein [Mucilaginibacter sp.]
MKTYLLTLCAAGLLLAACHNQPNKSSVVSTTPAGAAADAPVMKFKDITHDFGKVKAGAVVSYAFEFTNNGKSPLIISNAQASCGCTTPEWPHTPVAPGSTGKIKVSFNSAGRAGLQDKQITMTANTNPAQTMVHLIGEVTTK